jgi:hypothetical protein
MFPCDGTGYGKSMYWEYVAKQVAFIHNEYCFCWDKSPPNIIVSPNYDALKIDPKSHVIKIKISCVQKFGDCCPNFSKTESQLEVMFKNFYKG